MAVRMKADLQSVLILVLTVAVGWSRGEYLGCYQDKEGTNRLISDYIVNLYSINTPKRCTNLCAKLGYQYAGVEAAHQCFCGDDKPSEDRRLSTADCDSPCAGNNQEKCGGDWKSSMYATGTLSPPTEAVGTTNGSYLGCFVDKEGTSRLMTDYLLEFDSLTPRRCIHLCTKLGFRFAGVQDRRQCFCGNDRPRDHKKVSESECNSPCTGNSNEICGGELRSSVYAGGALLEPSPEPVYMGCYEDLTENRLLSDFRYNWYEPLTPKKCMRICKTLGFPYAGVEVTVECWCSKERPSVQKIKEDSECNKICPTTNQKCGSDWRLSVYTYPVNDASQIEISDETVERTYLGCFEDKKRILPELVTYLFHINTPKKCIYICKRLGYDYAGVEYGHECYCGYERPPPELKSTEDKCSVSCPHKQEKCGGVSYIGVYSIE